MIKGQIVKGIAGFYFVKSGDTIYRCRARGVFKKQGMKPAVGDLVEMEEAGGEDDSIITGILPRKNSFIRPPVANVDCFLIVTAAASPDPVTQVIDKLLVSAHQAGADAIVCINKCDLAEKTDAEGKQALENIEKLKDIYENLYPLVCTSKGDEPSLKDLEKLISGRSVAFAGASGTGKSTILNRLLDEEHMETGKVSHKTNRGRHTTRHVEMIFLDEDTGIFDTPGFTSFDLPQMEAKQVGDHFPEICRVAGGCRYDDCVHMAEPDCAVKQALEDGEIHESRYASYCAFVEEARMRKQY